MKRLILPLLLISLALASCVKRPSGVLSDKKMTKVVADMELADAYIKSNPSGDVGSKSEAIEAYVLEKHGVSRAEYDSTMAWYARNVDDYYQFCNLVDKELRLRRSKISGASLSDTPDLWPYSRQAVISALSGSNALEFDFPSNDVEAGERVKFKFRINKPAFGSAILGVEYEDGLMSFSTRSLSSTKKLDITLQTDTAKKVTRIFGHMLLRDKNVLPLWLDSISLTKLPFDSMEYYNMYGQRAYKFPVKRRELPKKVKQDSVPNPDASIAGN